MIRQTSRRMFLYSGTAITVLGVAGIGMASLPVLRPEGAVISFLRRSVPDLDMSQTDLSSFAIDIIAKLQIPLHKGIAFYNLLEYDGLVDMAPRSVANSIERNGETVITAFMRSTDYLDPEREGQARYFGFADPYRNGCSNPLPGWLGSPGYG